MDKEYKIRLETAEKDDISGFLELLKESVKVSSMRTYPRRDGGYHHYLTIIRAESEMQKGENFNGK